MKAGASAKTALLCIVLCGARPYERQRLPGRSRKCVYLVRHGETEWDLSGQHTGITDIPLTAKGRKAVKLLEQVLANTDFTLVLTSPLHRTRETWELAGLGERVDTDGDLMEWNSGEYEGLTLREIHAKAPGWMIFSDGCPDKEEIGGCNEKSINQ